MMSSSIPEEIRQAARRLAEANVAVEPEMEAIYLFPSDEEIRLVEVEPGMIRSEQIIPYHFGPDVEDGTPFPMAIALIHPDDITLPPPEEWGSWDDAELIWPEQLPNGR